LNERFEQYINGKRENFHSNFPVRLKKILWEARSTPTLGGIKFTKKPNLTNFYPNNKNKNKKNKNNKVKSKPLELHSLVKNRQSYCNCCNILGKCTTSRIYAFMVG
jgi:hypothetical protein